MTTVGGKPGHVVEPNRYRESRRRRWIAEIVIAYSVYQSGVVSPLLSAARVISYTRMISSVESLNVKETGSIPHPIDQNPACEA